MNDSSPKLRRLRLMQSLPLRQLVILLLIFHSVKEVYDDCISSVNAFQVQSRYSNHYYLNNHQHHNSQSSNIKKHLLSSITNTRTTSPQEPYLSLVLLSTSRTSSSSSSNSDSKTRDESTGIQEEVHESVTGANNSSENKSLWRKGKQSAQQIRQSLASMYKKSSNEGDDDDKLTFRQKLAKMGLAAMLSYGFVSNMSYAVTVSCAWYIHNIQNKVSPLGPGQWKPFLMIYSGFWIFNNIVRPIRLGISLALVAPQFDRILNYIQTQYHVSRTVAIAITVFMANVVGTISAMSLGIVIASILSGVPIFP